MIKISTEIGSIASIAGEEKAIEYVAKAGFDAFDLSMFALCEWNKDFTKMVWTEHPFTRPDYIRFARRLRRIGEDNGIYCNQSHAPFPTAKLEEKHIKRAIECTAEVGGEICVIHPCNDYTAEQNAEMFMRFLPFAKEHNVKIAVENMWNWNEEASEACAAACSSAEDFKRHLDLLDDAYFVACVDIGHAEMRGLNTSAVKMIKTLGNKVQALHIHDNDRWHDSHMLPYTMQINWCEVLKALKGIGYQGDFTLEADSYLSANGFHQDNLLLGVKNIAESVKRLREEYLSIILP